MLVLQMRLYLAPACDQREDQGDCVTVPATHSHKLRTDVGIAVLHIGVLKHCGWLEMCENRGLFQGMEPLPLFFIVM